MPTPVLIGSPNTLHGLVTDFTEQAWELVDAFWPGALTLVARHQPSLQWDLGDTRGTVAIRMPLHPVAIELLDRGRPDGRLLRQPAPATRRPRTATRPRACSATPSRCTWTAARPRASCPSSIVDVTGKVPVLLRAGALDADELRKVVPDLEVAN